MPAHWAWTLMNSPHSLATCRAWHSIDIRSSEREMAGMSQTTKNLNILITRLDEELTTQIRRTADAERDLSFAREDLAEARASALASRTLADRNEDFIRAREENERLYAENNRLRRELDKYVGARTKEAGEWLRDTDPLALTIEINKILSESYSGSRSCDPFTEKIPVIKAVRTKWDLGLKESKDIVDAWYAEIAAKKED